MLASVCTIMAKEKTSNNMKVAGFLQLTERAIDQTPIHYLAITRTIKKDTVLVWDTEGKTIYIVPKKK